MAEQRYLYVMISHTGTGVGRLIRGISRYRFNHVAMTLDPSFRKWYSFARINRNVALYGGFIEESAERYFAFGTDVPVKIFKLPISEKKYAHLTDLFAKAGTLDNELVYNFFDILAAIVGWQVKIPGAYTCLGFCCTVIEHDFKNIRELEAAMGEYVFHDGNLAELVSDSGSREDRYFSRLRFPRTFLAPLKNFAVLCSRIFDRDYNDIVIPK